LRASMAYREVTTAIRPPGRTRCRALMMKWLWMLCPPGLWMRSVRANEPNGTLPIAKSKLFSLVRKLAKDSLAMSASG